MLRHLRLLSVDIQQYAPEITNFRLSIHQHNRGGDTHYYTHQKKNLYKDGNPWTKKSSDFDVTMGRFDGAELCELVGPYLLSQLQHLAMNVGPYRDDGLAITNKPPRAVENMK